MEKLTALWGGGSSLDKTVKFITADNVIYQIVQVLNGQKINKPSVDPTAPEGKEFKGWTINGTEITFPFEPTLDEITIVAKFEEKSTGITYDLYTGINFHDNIEQWYQYSPETGLFNKVYNVTAENFNEGGRGDYMMHKNAEVYESDDSELPFTKYIGYIEGEQTDYLNVCIPNGVLSSSTNIKLNIDGNEFISGELKTLTISGMSIKYAGNFGQEGETEDYCLAFAPTGRASAPLGSTLWSIMFASSKLNLEDKFNEVSIVLDGHTPQPGEDILNETLTFEDGATALSHALSFENHRSYLISVDDNEPQETFSFVVDMEGVHTFMLNGIKTYSEPGEKGITSLAMYASTYDMYMLQLAGISVEDGEHNVKITVNPNVVRTYGTQFSAEGIISSPTFRVNTVLTGADIPNYASAKILIDNIEREIVEDSFTATTLESLPDVMQIEFEVVNSDSSFVDDNSKISITLKGDNIEDLVLYENEPVHVLSQHDTICACDNITAIFMMSM